MAPTAILQFSSDTFSWLPRFSEIQSKCLQVMLDMTFSFLSTSFQLKALIKSFINAAQLDIFFLTFD